MARNDWQLPGTYEVAPGVHRIPLVLPDAGLAAVNAYVLEDEDGIALIDPGQAYEQAIEPLHDGLAAIGHRLADVRRVLVTHTHRDHYTRAVQIRREVGSRIGVGEHERISLEILTEPGRERVFGLLQRLPECGAAFLLPILAELFSADTGGDDDWEMPDTFYPSGHVERIGTRSIAVIATPGHTRGHVVYRDATAGLLFSGDHVLPHITPSIGFEPAPVPLPLADFLASLRLMRSIPDTLLLPAHGPVAPSVHERVEEILAHHDTRLALTLDRATPGPVSAYDVARRLGWTRRLRLLDDLDPMNQMLAILETKAHLDVLVVRGQAHYRDDGPVRLYSA